MTDRIGESGLLTAVYWQWLGTELALDVAAGETVVFVRNPEAVSANEEFWIGDTGPYRVLAVDDTAVTLDTPLTVPMEESEPFVPDMGGEPGQAWYAEVVLPDNEEPIEVPMTWQDRLTLPEGEYDPPRAIVLSEDLQRIVDLPHQTPGVPYGSITDPPEGGESGSTVYPQDEPPWPNGTIDKPHGDMWIETDNDMHKWFWDSGSMMWIDANDPQLDLLDDIEGLPVGDTTLGEIADSVVNANETAFSARNLAATADGRVSFSDYDPVPADTAYYATGNDDDLIEGLPFSISASSLTAGVATLTLTDGSLTNSEGELFIVSGVGAPYDGVWTIETNVPPTEFDAGYVTYRITGQADIAEVVYDPPLAAGFNTVILNRVEGSVWFTRTRSRLNHNTNPSFEVDLNGWSVANAAATRLLAAGPEAVIAGDHVMRVANDATVGDHRVEWAGGVPGHPVNLGETWAVTAFGLLESGSGIGCYASVRFYRSDGSFHSEVNGPAVELVAGDDWRELTVTATVPLPDDSIGELPVTHMVAGAFHNPNANAVWYLDGAMAEQAEYTGRYFDGSSYDSEWLGTPHQSESSMEGGKIISVWELYDGDWVNLDFTGTTQYDADASDLTKGILNPDLIEDRSLSQDKLATNVVITQEALDPGDLVNIFESGGGFFIRRANASNQREAHGFVLNSAIVGDVVPVYTSGYNPFCTGMTPGPEFLSAITPGKVTDVPPNAAGTIIQEVGAASDPTTLHFNPQQPVLLF